MPRLTVLVLALVLLLVPGARAAGPVATSAAIDRQMDLAGPASGAVVVDLDSGATLYAARPGVPRVPASVNKLNTTLAALVRFGADGTLDTLALAPAEPDAFGRIQGDLYLRGGGDPTFASAGTAAIARRLRLAGITEIEGAVRADESLFDRLRGPLTWAPSSWLAPLSALGFEQRWTRDPAGSAARAMTVALAQVGIT